MDLRREEPFGKTIRLKYSMTINYVGRLVAIAINILFTLIITRKLGIAEFSWWIILNKYMVYAVAFTSVYTMWTNRAISRGWNVSKISLKMSLILGVFAIVISIPAVVLFNLEFGVPVEVLLSFMLLLFEEYIIRALLSISRGYKPHYIGIYNVLLAAFKTALAYLLIIICQMGILGAMLSLVISKVFLLGFLFIYNRGMILGSTYNREVVSRWLKYSWYSLSLMVVSTLHNFDVIIVRYLTGNELVIALYGAIFLLINLIGAPIQSRTALYSKILAKQDFNIINEALWLTLLFLTPLISIVSALSKPIIAVFGVKYLMISDLVVIFAVAVGFRVIYFVSRDTALAWERRDENILVDFKLRETALFDVLMVEIIQVCIYLSLITAIPLLCSDPHLIICLWGLVFLLRAIIGLVLINMVTMKKFGFLVFRRDNVVFIVRYAFIGTIIYIIGTLIPVGISERFYTMLSNLILPVASLSALYGLLVLTFDKKARFLVRYILKKIGF